MKSVNSNKNRKDSDYNSVMRELAPYMNLGIQMLIPILLGALGGYYLDKEYDSAPVWTLILAFLGIAIGFYTFFKTVLGEEKKKNTEDHKEEK